MKYIRTITGVYKTGRNFKLKVGENIHIPNEGVVKIIKEADTIEELCDEFVVNNTICYKSDNRFVIYLDEGTEDVANKGTIYGAIWTDKGLIYVAKMNSNGELELL